MKARFLSPASSEALIAAKQYEAYSQGLGRDFVAELRATVRLLREYPLSGMNIGDGVRKLGVRRFPYNVIYLIDNDQLIVVAVAHQKRLAGYWRGRIG